MKRFIISWLVLLIVLVPLSGCGANSEREAIITFTRQALEIEGKRNELMTYLSSLYPPLLPENLYGGQRNLINTFFLKGISANSTFVNAPPSGIDGMTSLTQKVLLLDCPQSIQSIKDSLVYIYTSEVGLDYTKVYPDVTKDNVKARIEIWSKYENISFGGTPFADALWVKLQLQRIDVYSRWAEILREHGIDPAKEGLAP